MANTDDEQQEFEKYLEHQYMVFEKLRIERHEKGQQEYGEFTFLENDIIRMMLEELADVVNYATMHAVKLLMLNDQMAEELGDKQKVQIGFEAFKGTKDVGWIKP